MDLRKLNDIVKMMLLKKLYMINWLKSLMLFKIMIQVTQFKKLTTFQKCSYFKDIDNSDYISAWKSKKFV